MGSSINHVVIEGSGVFMVPFKIYLEADRYFYMIFYLVELSTNTVGGGAKNAQK